MNIVPSLVLALGALVTTASVGGCVKAQDPSNLNPAGPPDIKQVLVTERMAGGTDLNITYGTHPDIDDGMANEVATAVVSQGGQQMHIVFDELLDGKTVEQFQCACTNNCDAGHDWSVDPFDCSACGDDSGTPANEAGRCLDAVGGVADGLPDVSELQPHVADIDCATSGMAFHYEVGSSGQADGFYNPSGNQLVPFGEGIAGLGPSFILTPQVYLPTNVDCTLKIAATVKDKDGVAVPANELPTFHTEPLALIGSSPADGQTKIDGTGLKISATFNTDISGIATNATNFTVHDMTAAADVVGTFSVDTGSAGDVATAIFDGTFPSGHTFVVTVATGFTDKYGGALPAAETFTFTTK